MSSSSPASPGPVAGVPAAAVPMPASAPVNVNANANGYYAGSVRSTPGFATRTPVHLGLSGHSGIAAPRRAAPSLSIRTADGSRVSILNDCDDAEADHCAAAGGSLSADHKRCASVPGISASAASAGASPFRAQSTPGAATPQYQQRYQQQPSVLPSLTTLVQAVHMVSSAAPATMKRSISSSSGVGHAHSHIGNNSNNNNRSCHPCNTNASHSPVPMSAPPVASSTPMPAYASAAPAGTKSTGKRKYKCVFGGCGKAFTTSGHLARHQRIHTGEKNFPCLFLGCSSRFSRQDNMMQHYRTHLSTKSRRNASPRKVVFVEQQSDHPYRAAHSLYAAQQVYSGSHPIQHHQQHSPYGPPPHRSSAAHQSRGMAASASGSGAPSAAGSHKASAHYGLPPVHMHAAIPKQSPTVAHSGAMSFY
ncbi:hypothetical protein GGI11_008391 [Coemansia sp. RSA 2049]|nr:hypothetical protein GGI11_008391 [Coemansia sp. RSA 2049]